MMKQALYIIPYPKFFSQHAGVGGHIAHAAGILNGLVEHGFSMKVIADEGHDIFSAQGIELDVMPCRGRSIISRQFWSIQLIKHIRNLVRENKPEICYMRYSAGFAPWIPLLKRVLGDVPLILEVNSLGSQWRPGFRFVDRWALQSADRIICISDSLKSFIDDLLDGHQSDVRLVINGVDVERFAVEPVNLCDDDKLHVGFAGLLKADYGIETMIEAARELQDQPVMLHIFGDGPIRTELESQAADLKNMVFHGPIPFLDMPAYLRALDVLVYTTAEKHLYQSPTKLFEYMAAGKPIVSAKTPQTTTLLAADETALFFDVCDAQGMANAIITLLQSPEKQYSMGRAVLQEAKTKHSWSARVADILEPSQTD